MRAYAVILDWSTSDDSHVDIELFDTYTKAFQRFNEIIENEKNPEISWVADAFDEHGEILDGYEFDECQPDTSVEAYAYWNITNKYNWSMHDYIAIVQLEMK